MQNRWSSYSFGDRPAFFKPYADQSVTAAKPSRPVAHGQGFPVMRDVDVRATVPVLLIGGGPFAVFRTVRAVVVDAIKRVIFSWPRSHIGEKISKRASPAVAYSNPSPSIAVKVLDVFVVAPIDHRLIDPVLRGSTHAVRSAMNFCRRTGCFSMQASARLCSAIGKSSSSRGYNAPAIADALPHGSLHPIRGYVAFSPLNHGKPVELLTSKVFEFWHFRHLEKFTFERAWQSVVKLIFGSYPSHARSILTCGI